MKDRVFLEWLADRLVNQYGEDTNVDFVRKLRSIARSIPPEQETPNTSEVIKGERFWTGGFTIHKEDDPKLEVGEVRWFQTKEPGLMRPMTRMRWRIESRAEEGEYVTYNLAPVAP